MNKTLSQIWTIFSCLMTPLFQGTLIESLHFLVFLVFLRFIGPYITSLTAFPSNFDSILLDPSQEGIFKTGRLSTIILLTSVFFLFATVNKLICKLNHQDESYIIKEEVKRLASEHQTENGQVHRDKEKNREFTAEPTHADETEFSPHHNPLISPNLCIKYKRHLFYISLILVMIFFAYLIQIKDFIFFQQLAYLFVFVMSLLELGILLLLAWAFEGEIMLLCPIIGAFEFVQSICFFESSYYNSFEVFMVRMICIFVLRFFAALFLKAKQLIANIDKNDFAVHFPYFLNRFLLWLKKKTETERHRPLSNFKFGLMLYSSDELSKEDIMVLLCHLCSKGAMNLLRLVYMFSEAMFVFSGTSKFAEAINTTRIISALAFMLIFVSFDVLTILLFEVLFEFNVVHAMLFYAYRYKNRRYAWLASPCNFDLSVDIRFRSTDYLGFSRQFYRSLTGIMLPVVVISFALYEVLLSNYNLFNDVACLIGVFFTFLLFSFYRWIWSRLHKLLFPFKKRDHKTFEKLGTTLLLENYMRKEYNVYGEDFIIKRFIQAQRSYLIENLDKVLGKADFRLFEGFLFDLYMKIANNLKADEVTKVRDEIMGKHMAVFGKASNANENKIVKTSRKHINKVATLLHYWQSLAKEVIFFREKVQDLKDRFRKQLCERCHTDEKLLVIEDYNFNEMITKFKIYLAGLPATADKWRDFYQRKQIFKTLCQNCAKLRQISTFTKYRRKENGEIEVKQLQSAFFGNSLKNKLHEISQEKQNMLKIFLIDWLMAAKSNVRMKHMKRNQEGLNEKIMGIFQN